MVIVNLIRAAGSVGSGAAAGGAKPPNLLLSRVYNHALWNKVTFWEEALVIGICEAHAVEAVARRTLPAGSQFVQPAMTVFLQRFIGYMMAFGISLDQGRNAVSTALRKNNSLLGNTSKPYAALLLQTYEAAAMASATAALPQQPAPSPFAVGPGALVGAGTARCEDDQALAGGGSATASAPGGGSPGGGLPEASEVSSSALSAPPGAAEDDFEAVALGLPTGDASTPAPDSCEEEEEAGDEALKELAETQPSVDDVFT